MKDPLIGINIHNVDEKGRLAIPSKLRAELGEPFYILCFTNDCLSVYSEEEWKKLTDKFNAIPQSDLKAQRSVRLIYSSACKCEPDKQGRVLIPQLLREKVGIDKEVVTIGASNRAEIWAKEKWQSFVDEESAGDNNAIAGLADYGI